MIPYLTLTDKSGTVYSFPMSFFIKDDSFAMRSSVKELLFNHGGKQVSDSFINSRKLSIEGSLHADDSSTFETNYRALMQAIYKGGTLRIVTDTVARFCGVTNPSVDQQWEYYGRQKDINITFDMVFPFWQDDTEVTDTFTLAGNDTFDIDLSGSDSLVLPVIEILSDQGVDVPAILLRNVTDNGISITVNDPSFLSGNTMIIDCEKGTIFLNNSNAIAYYVSGAFLRLQPGVNSFEYEGAACTIIFRYRKVYL